MREFSINATDVTVAGATTLAFVNPAAAPSVNIEILRAWVGFAANATSAQQKIQIVSQVTAFPTLTSYTPRKRKPADPNASVITGATNGAAGTCGINASAEGAGTKTVELPDACNVLNGWLWIPTPPETMIWPAGSSSGLGLYFPTAPSTLTNWSGGFVYREV